MPGFVDANELGSYFEGKKNPKLARIFRRSDSYIPVEIALTLARRNGYNLTLDEIKEYVKEKEPEE